MKSSFTDTTRDYLSSVFGGGPDTHQGCRVVAGPVAATNQMEIPHHGFTAAHEMAKRAEGRMETSVPNQMAVVELTQTVEGGSSGELAGIGELTWVRKRKNVPEVRAGIATENPTAATRVKR